MFPKNSSFTPDPSEKPESLRGVPIRHVGRPNTVEIPLDLLDQWIDTLDVITDAYGGDELVDVIQNMRSYLRG
jgi:hypothetical protein